MGKKAAFVIAAVAVIFLLFFGCSSPYEGKGTLRVFLVAYNSGHGVESAVVTVKDHETGAVIFTDTTDESGFAHLVVPGLQYGPRFVDIEAKKNGYALSAMRGLRIENGEIKVVEMIMKEAKLSSDPDNETFPDVTLEFYDMNNDPLDLTSPISGQFQVKVSVNAQNHVSLIYLSLGNVPGSGFFTERSVAENTPEATFTVDPTGWTGETELHVVVYDKNDNRVHVVKYLNIQSTTEVPQNMFVPAPATDYGSPNLIAYTRDDGIEFYGGEGVIQKVREKYHLVSREVKSAPKGTNLWVEVYWMGYSDVGDPSLPEPDGYNVYRSFDGEHYQWIGFTKNNYYRDHSPLLAPGKRIWYAVSSVYGGAESERVELGSVVPLDIFKVRLLEPEDGAIGVSAQPTLRWSSDRALNSPEGEVVYHYSTLIMDFVQSEYYLLPVDNYGYLYDWSATQTEISAPFVSEEYQWLHTKAGFTERLEYSKTYSWGMYYAYAEVADEDSVAMSIACDLGIGYDPFGELPPEKYNEFTTTDE
ncbi:carboxypeptidase regulatory-like domain-containing protein [Thermotoga sp. KOL6]|uniref:carboxypeptidase regulatory-like domain-containing protein n=1 Tax=Thermotoga sp. KOL6 TaxID=126741 RepID=UPI000C76FE6C|nr:carboxypeptidase regulatory-like domain-containing protein [Thermotoga sp. KOL6]PLV59346.1 hypothetical protein AS005_06300 [Thermotoga sp. KOL6]